MLSVCLLAMVCKEGVRTPGPGALQVPARLTLSRVLKPGPPPDTWLACLQPAPSRAAEGKTLCPQGHRTGHRGCQGVGLPPPWRQTGLSRGLE